MQCGRNERDPNTAMHVAKTDPWKQFSDLYMCAMTPIYIPTHSYMSTNYTPVANK